MMGIIHNDFTEIDPEFKSEFNAILSNLRISIFNYLSELINIETPKFKKDGEISQIKSYSVCLSVADISRLLKMIKATTEEINLINDKIPKKVDRIYQMSEDNDIFGVRKDK